MRISHGPRASAASALIVVAVAALAMLFVGGSASADTGCAPGPNEISLFADANYGGQCATFEVGDFASLGALDNAASSVSVGANVVAVLEQFPGLTNCCDDQWSAFEASDPDLSEHRTTRIGAGGIVDNTASALFVLRTNCVPGPHEVALFDHADETGGCVNVPAGDYSTTLPLGLPNDFASSIVVGAAASGTAYVDINLGGAQNARSAPANV